MLPVIHMNVVIIIQLFLAFFLNMPVCIYVVEGMINAMGERRGRKTSSI